jgi:glutamate transport system permease protein
MAASVLFDAPGPKAKVRNNVLAVVTILVVAGIIAFLVIQLGKAGQFEAKKWSIFSYPLVQRSFAEATLATLKAFGLAAVLSLVLGFLLALGRLSDHGWVRAPVTWIVELFRAVPLLILMMLFYYGLPTVGIKMTPFVAVVVGLTLYNGAVLSEVFRAGVNALPRGQAEAAYAVGLRKGQVMTSILLPQAIKSMLPAIIAQLVVILKDTALGFIITYTELLYYVKYLGTQVQFGSPIIPAAMVGAVIYIGMCLILSGLAKYAEHKINKSPKVAKSKAVMDAEDAGAAPINL